MDSEVRLSGMDHGSGRALSDPRRNKRGRNPIFSPDGCLPDKVGALIETERGVRQVQGDELAKAKGVPIGVDDCRTS